MRYKSGSYRKYKQQSRRTRNAVILAIALTALAIAAVVVANSFAAEDGEAELIDINTADAMELTTLPGIGPSKANAIVEYRKAHGPFKSIEDLIKVKGIGAKTLNNIKQLITASDVVKKKMSVVRQHNLAITTWAKIKTGR